MKTQTLEMKGSGKRWRASGPWFKHLDKEMEMNKTVNSTGGDRNPAAKGTRTDKEILDDLDGMVGDVSQLRRAALVLDEYTNDMFRNSKDLRHNAMFSYGLNQDQVDGITYMADHVRYLALALEQAVDRAFGLEVRS
ncbi:hypothetical protein G6K88_15630 [Agrobacterium rhizogenes]|uniref:hypothetical protein n=1 Tax=Rhizobium rhizogenes TaxID=359 RepID=UPI0015717632|nr:hypothetical protein [Rhizobium rhizogenes]NTI03454.1 hypothetical protein [Rhizobium rhizogenes]NTI10259.1 hypothetical protein [Rhizobium rhizogenes]